MSTLRAQNTWETSGSSDFLQLLGQGGDILAGIDSTGTGYGALAGGGTISGSIASTQVAVGSGTNSISGSSALVFTNLEGIAALSSNIGEFLIENTSASGSVNIVASSGAIVIDARSSPGLSVNPAGQPVLINAHLNAFSGDLSGTVSISSSTSASVAFSSNFTGTTAPSVVLTPQSDPTTAGGYWVTYSGGSGAWTGFTVNIHNSTSIVFNYLVIGVKA